MAMSRSLGASWLTVRSPIRMVPDVISSSPATMRSAVVLPHPDGPTKTMNSWSSMERLSSETAWVPFGYTFDTRSSCTTLISGIPSVKRPVGGSPERSRRKARHDASLGEQHEESDGNGDYDH